MARPLREQFALATLLLLIPVSGVIVWAGTQIYAQQIQVTRDEADRLASFVASHLAESGPKTGPEITQYLQKLAWPDPDTLVRVRSGPDTVIAERRPESSDITERLSGSATVAPFGWKVEVGIPTKVAVARGAATVRHTVYITALATFIMILLEAFFLRRWLPSLTHFQETADRVGAGDLQPPPKEPMPSREFEHVRNAFAGMVDNLREAQSALARQVEYERGLRQEMQSLQQQIIRQERLAAIGTLLSGIAHELNNPLQAITGLSDVLQRDRLQREDVRADLALIQKESRRASAIIRNLSRFGRQQGTTPVAVMLSDIILSVVELRQRRLQELDIDLVVEERALQPAHAVFAELQQVLLNFVVNAEYAVVMPGATGRRIVIRTIDREAWVRVEVDDTGPGVPKADEHKLFQPFFTTKPIGEGTGLGLSVSYGIMQSYGGTIGHEPRPGGGARFFFEVPAEPDEATPPRGRSTASAMPVVQH